MALILKRTSVSRTSGEWREDDYDVLADGIVVGRIMKAAAAPEGTPWLWTLAYGHHEDPTPTHGYEATREAAMAAFRKSWQREQHLGPQQEVPDSDIGRALFDHLVGAGEQRGRHIDAERLGGLEVDR